MEREVYRRWFVPALVVFCFASQNFAVAEVFVADFNGDGKPDVLMSSPAAPEGFVVLLNQGEWDGKMTFRKTWPEIKSAGAATALPTYTTPSGYTPPALPPAATTGQTTTWTPTPTQTTTSWTPPPASPSPPPTVARPAIAPPPPPSISSSTPKLKTMGYGSAAPRTQVPMSPTSAGSASPTPQVPMSPTSAGSRQPEPAASAQNFTFGSRKVALFNYKDKTAGSQFAWLERGIANILKFDVLEVKSIQLIDREKTDLTFDPAWFRGSNLAADIVVTGEFEEAAERLIVTTWFLSPSMSAIREFKVEGDRADIFSLIEKVGSRLKQELSSL